MARPKEAASWCNDDDPSKITEPSSTKKLAGFIYKERPAFDYINWLFRNLVKWILHIDLSVNHFDAHEASTPDMTVLITAGKIKNGLDNISLSAQVSGTITAPSVNPRIDRVVIDNYDGLISIITGAEAASPVAPLIIPGKTVIAQILLQTSTTAITNDLITDERTNHIDVVGNLFSFEQFGAKGDAIQVEDGAITSGATTFTSATAGFASADVGKSIAVFNAGASTASLHTTIASYTNSTTVELTDAAGTTVSSAVSQIGTDDAAAIQACIDAVDTLGYGKVSGHGSYMLHTNDNHLRASNVSYDFTGARFLGYGVGIVDTRTLTRQLTNITGIGGSFEPIGDSISSGSVNYNGFYILHAQNVHWLAPKMNVRQGTRGLSIQTDTSYGATPFAGNIKDIIVSDIMCIGDGTTNDGVDITSNDITASGLDNLIQNVRVTGEVRGCMRGSQISTGDTDQINETIHVDLDIYDATTIAAECGRSRKSTFNIRAYGCTAAGVSYTRNEESAGKFKITGNGAALTTALLVEDNGVDTHNTIEFDIGYDGTNKWATGVSPIQHDVTYKSGIIDGAVIGIDPSGFRSVWDALIFRNCTTNISDADFALTTNQWGRMIDMGDGTADPKNMLRQKGSGSISSGTTTDVIVHNLSFIPSAEDIIISGKEDPTSDIGAIWVNNFTATEFTVNVTNDPGASNWDFAWRADII